VPPLSLAQMERESCYERWCYNLTVVPLNKWKHTLLLLSSQCLMLVLCFGGLFIFRDYPEDPSHLLWLGV
jgi:hypothetical protein